MNVIDLIKTKQLLDDRCEAIAAQLNEEYRDVSGVTVCAHHHYPQPMFSIYVDHEGVTDRKEVNGILIDMEISLSHVTFGYALEINRKIQELVVEEF